MVRALTMMNQLFIEGGVVDNASTTGFRSSVAQVFGGEERAATLYGADFVLSIIQSETSADAGKDFDYFGFPSVDTSDPAVVAGGDIAVAFTDRSEAQTLLAFLATKDSAAIWARQGGFVSPNQKVNRRDYRDDMTKEAGESLTQHMTGTGSFRFDLSDRQPPAFGATPGHGLRSRLRGLLEGADEPQAVAEKLETDAAAAHSAPPWRKLASPAADSDCHRGQAGR